jgi:predicted nucleic acid-binding protein
MAVIDASVQVAILNDADRHHSAALGWYREALVSGEPLAAPSLLVAEVAAALRRGLGDAALAKRAIEELLAGSEVTLVAVDRSLAVSAAEIAADHGLRACDAVYVALAADLGEPLVALDRDQTARARALIEVFSPASP